MDGDLSIIYPKTIFYLLKGDCRLQLFFGTYILNPKPLNLSEPSTPELLPQPRLGSLLRLHTRPALSVASGVIVELGCLLVKGHDLGA